MNAPRIRVSVSVKKDIYIYKAYRAYVYTSSCMYRAAGARVGITGYD